MNNFNLAVIFIFGGILMVAIYLASNVYQNTAISAILSLLPLSIISCYVIREKNLVLGHCKNLIPVLLITLICIIILIYIVSFCSINIYLSISLVILIWFILQYLRIIYYPI